MKSTPAIIVQIVHIQGPLKGEIQEFAAPEILVGRHPSCHVHFPKDLAIISRQHARIVREGNRFKLIDHSTNGTFVNGKRLREAYLKDGDVLIFAEGGPKVSFLTRMAERQPEMEDVLPSDLTKKRDTDAQKLPSSVAPPPKPAPPEGIPAHKIRVPLIIQYGPTLQSFKELPVTLGKSPNSDFILNHPAIHDRHAEFFFSQDQYWVKDLTGRQLISVDRQTVGNQPSSLRPDSEVSLSPQGPKFRFLGEGRLAEIEAPVPEESLEKAPEREAPHPSPEGGDKGTKKSKSIFKKIFQR